MGSILARELGSPQVPHPKKEWPSRENHWLWPGRLHCYNIIRSGIPSSSLHLSLSLPVSLEHEDPQGLSKLSWSSVSPTSCFHFLFYSDWTPLDSALQLSHLPIICQPFSFHCSVVCDRTVHLKLISHLFFLLRRANAKFWGEWTMAVSPGQILIATFSFTQKSFTSLVVLFHASGTTNITIFFRIPPHPITHPQPLLWNEACQLWTQTQGHADPTWP